jgi:uridine kinase
LPGIGIWKEYSPDKIEKIAKKRKIEKPNPKYTQHTEPNKQWTMPIVDNPGKLVIIFGYIILKITNLIIKSKFSMYK